MMSPSVSPHASPNAAATVDPLEGSSQLVRDFLGGLHGVSPDQLSPDDSSGTHRRAPVQRRARHAVCGRRDEDSPDLLSPNSSSSRAGQGRPEAVLCGYPLPELVVFYFLTFNSTMAIYRSWGDVGCVLFVVCTYLSMASLFLITKKFEAAPPNSKRRKELMVCVWMFNISLAIGFVYQIISTTAKPTLHLALLLWAIPAGTGISVFIIFSDRSGAQLSEERLDV